MQFCYSGTPCHAMATGLEEKIDKLEVNCKKVWKETERANLRGEPSICYLIKLILITNTNTNYYMLPD